MTEHPITPPHELVKQWTEYAGLVGINEYLLIRLATLAARWGADQELEACVEWMGDSPVIWRGDPEEHPGFYLREARRPKSPSLKEQALSLLQVVEISDDAATSWDFSVIRRALEALDD